MLKKGWGVNKNTRQAREWYNKAVENAKKEGRHLLSIDEYYKSGASIFTYHGGYISSKEWYTYIKLDGDSETVLCFSFLYDRNHDTEPEYEDLFLWCRKLAENGNVLAQTELGIMYLCAEGIQQNLEAAYKCFSIAAEKKDALASFLLSLMYKNGDVVKQDNSKAEELWQKSKFNLTVKEISYYSDIYYKNRNGVSPKFNKPKQEYPQINPKQEPSSVYDISKKEVTIIDKELTIKEIELNKDVFNMPNPVTIMGRSSSITNSFVNGIIPVIEPTEDEIHDALTILEQNKDDVRCVYCGDKKTEWDHLYPLIVNKKHTGYITEIANLVPACGKCNQSKGNSNWKEWMLSNAEKSPKTRGIKDLDRRIEIIENYDKHFQKRIINLEELAGKELWEKYQRAYDSIIFNMESAQNIMDEIKKKISVSPANVVSKTLERPRKVFLVNKRPEVQFELYPKTKDTTQFMVNGTPTGGKGPTVYAAVKAFIDSHPNISVQELKSAFPDYLAKPGFGKMIRKVEDVTPNEWSGSRFNKHPISLSDGTRITVSTQWKPDNMQSFIEGVKKLGIAIVPVN